MRGGAEVAYRLNAQRPTFNVQLSAEWEEYPISNVQFPMSKCEVEFGNWKLEVGHWKFIMGLR
jgi:hypothetical protein